MRKGIFYVLVAVGIIAFVSIRFGESNKHTLSENEEKGIIQTVNNYYQYLEDKRFVEALSLCLIDEKNNDLHMDISSRAITLRELWENIYITFQTDKHALRIQYDEKEKSYSTEVSYTIKYKNTRGGMTKDILYLNEVNGKWKIVKIRSLDRYVSFRVGKYNLERAVEFLTPIENNSY